MVFPQGHTADFVIGVLRAWRAGAGVCPLEMDQTPPAIPPPPHPCVHLKMTSATTGAPRVIAFTAAQLAADAENIVATMGLRPDWPNLGAISLAHSYGFSNLVLPLLLHGVPLILASSPLPESVRQAAAGEAALTLPGVPALWRAWHEAGAISPNVRLAISAGAPLPVALERAVFDAVGLKIHNFYGSSECGGIAYDTTAELRSADACVGTAVQNVRLAVSGEGCLRVRSGAVGETYWPEPTESLGHGLFQTGDLAEIKQGQVFLLGRASDFINVAGRKVLPETIERALGQHPRVQGCVVFGVPSTAADRTETVVAAVMASQPVGTKALKSFLLERIPAWQVPREWWFVESPLANSRGKISRAGWRGKYLEAQSAAKSD